MFSRRVDGFAKSLVVGVGAGDLYLVEKQLLHWNSPRACDQSELWKILPVGQKFWVVVKMLNNGEYYVVVEPRDIS